MDMLSWLQHHGARIEHSAPNQGVGDSDLVPVAVILWIGSVIRVVAGVGGEVFPTEAALAFLCVIVIPCWLLWSWAQAKQAASDPRRSASSDPAQTPQK